MKIHKIEQDGIVMWGGIQKEGEDSIQIIRRNIKSVGDTPIDSQEMLAGDLCQEILRLQGEANLYKWASTKPNQTPHKGA